MSTERRPAHSPLGASSAERWMNCACSVALIKSLRIREESDEPDYRTEGTAAHYALQKCLTDNIDAWELIGEKMPNGTEVDGPMSDAVQVFLDEARSHTPPGAEIYIEFGIDAPDFHKQFYGTLDYGAILGDTLIVNDYKHGAGIAVDVKNNPQIMYYAFGLLRHHPEVKRVVLRIIQPRGYHPDGAVRVWETTADYIRTWADQELRPAMLRTEFDNDLDAGPHCRFCPAKLVCPLMESLFGAAMTCDPKKLINLTDDALGRSWYYLPVLKMYAKAMEEEAFRRLNSGRLLGDGGPKLVNKKADRVWKPGSIEILKSKFGDDVMTKPVLKTPAQIEGLGAEAKKIVHEYAYTPQTGLTVAPYDDKRPAVKVTTAQEAFGSIVDKLVDDH